MEELRVAAWTIHESGAVRQLFRRRKGKLIGPEVVRSPLCLVDAGLPIRGARDCGIVPQIGIRDQN